METIGKGLQPLEGSQAEYQDVAANEGPTTVSTVSMAWRPSTSCNQVCVTCTTCHLYSCFLKMI